MRKSGIVEREREWTIAGVEYAGSMKLVNPRIKE